MFYPITFSSELRHIQGGHAAQTKYIKMYKSFFVWEFFFVLYFAALFFMLLP